MTALHPYFAAVSAVILFIYGLQGFSRELQAVGGVQLRVWLEKVTAYRWLGFLVGALATAVVQSSSAVTSLTAALVDASVISFRASLGVLLGANVGTTATAWLVSLKLTGMGPVFIVLGAGLSALPHRASMAGKAVFYFGLIFFALDLISAELQPLREHPVLVAGLSMAATPWVGIVFGMFVTAVIQSSSVTTGVAILLVQQGALPPESAIYLVVGANVGSTSTALLASVGMGAAAKASARANALFNLVGMLLFWPFLPWFAHEMLALAGEPGPAVALAHLVFNLTTAALFLLPLPWLADPLQHHLLREAR